MSVQRRSGSLHSFFHSLRTIASLGGGSGATAVEKRSLLVVVSSMSAAGIVWGTTYLLFDEPLAAAIPYGYAALTLVNVLVYKFTDRDALFRFTQVLLTLLLPFLLMVELGGFVSSSAVGLWSLVAPVAALVVLGERAAVRWFTAYAALIVAGGLLEPLWSRSNNLPPFAITAFFIMNVTSVSALTFVLLRHFFVQKNAAVAAYVQQETALRQSEKLATLGRLSAGMAHELNNPAAAAKRGAALLEGAIAELQRIHRDLGATELSDLHNEQLTSLDRFVRERALSPARLDPVALADREEEIDRWLEESGTQAGADRAAALAEMGYSVEDLERLTASFPAGTHPTLVAWLAVAYNVYGLLAEIGRGAAQISEIVEALKAYSYMDRGEIQEIDVTEGLESTLVMLRSRIHDGIRVSRDYAPGFPLIQACGSELNQVWTNIIDNALYVLDGSGEITLRARGRDGWVDVEIEDNGPGIPESVRERIFDPFFTTKPPGSGTGLGLSISHTIVVQKHGGRLSVESKPGLTRFTVSLPARSAA